MSYVETTNKGAMTHHDIRSAKRAGSTTLSNQSLGTAMLVSTASRHIYL